jgi:maltose O-acetyltransferase
MIRRIFLKLLHKCYVTGKHLDQQYRYEQFRKTYNIHPSFRFNGEDILLYGDGEIHCAEDSYIGSLSTVQAYKGQKVIIGKGCSISHNVRIYSQTLDADQDFSRFPLIEKKGDVIIEDYVWIGANVFINPKVTIGKNSIIGANSVVTKDVPPNAIVGGVPAKLVRMKNIYDVH